MVPQSATSFRSWHVVARDEPGRIGEERILPHDLLHQPLAAGKIAQAGKDARIDFVAKAVILDAGVAVDEQRIPGDPAVTVRQHGLRQARGSQVDFHPEAPNVAHRRPGAAIAKSGRGIGFSQGCPSNQAMLTRF